MTGLILNSDGVKGLAKAKPVGPNLNIQYWSPEKSGEAKTVVLLGYLLRTFPDQNDTDKTREVPCAVFIDSDETVWENGSAILVSCLKEQFKQGDSVYLEFVGTKKSKKGNNCQNWKVLRAEVAK